MAEWNPRVVCSDAHEVMRIKAHSLEKYQLVKIYCDIFANAMRPHWPNLFYIDLFSGPGIVQVDGEREFVESPALAVMNQRVRFDRYIYCDKKQKNIDALKCRAPRSVATSCGYFNVGDCNQVFPTILNQMPPLSSENRGLSFCYVDPFALSNLSFSTLQALSTNKKIDFLVLIPTGMDADRNTEAYYLNDKSEIVDNFLGRDDWRPEYLKAKENGIAHLFVLREFVKSMKNIGYKAPPEQSIHPIRATRSNAVLYHLAVFSKHDLGSKFWRESIKFTDPQAGFNF